MCPPQQKCFYIEKKKKKKINTFGLKNEPYLDL